VAFKTHGEWVREQVLRARLALGVDFARLQMKARIRQLPAGNLSSCEELFQTASS